MKKYFIIFSVTFFVTVLMNLFIRNAKNQIGLQGDSKEFNQEKDKLKRLFEEKGSVIAYDFFKSEYRKTNPKITHNLEHFVGSLLWEKEKEKGIVICDSFAGYGCYHGYFIRAFAGEGEKAISKAAGECKKAEKDKVRLAECIHGIGHGAMSLQRYTLDGLNKALDKCHNLSFDEFSGNICLSGVFMEYNIRTMDYMDKGEASYREFHSETPYEPCMELPQVYRERCFYELPYWWMYVLKNDFTKIGIYCEEIKDTNFRRSCLSGVGHVVPFAVSYDKEKIVAQCSKMASGEGNNLCLEEANMLLDYKGYHQPSPPQYPPSP